MIALITCFFNPANSKKLKSNYIEFRKHLNHPIVTVELAFKEQPFFIDDSIRLRGSNNNILWQKERLLNIALESLPKTVDKVAWLDADIIFENPNWLQEAEKALDDKPVIQLFEEVHESVDEKQTIHHPRSYYNGYYPAPGNQSDQPSPAARARYRFFLYMKIFW